MLSTTRAQPNCSHPRLQDNLPFLGVGLGLTGSECEGEGATIFTAEEDGLEKNAILRPGDDGEKQAGSSVGHIAYIA